MMDDKMEFNDLINGIWCMDALELMRALPDESIDLLLTDPPYNMLSRDVAWEYEIDLPAFWHEAERIITATGVIAICAAMPFAALLVASNLRLFRYEYVIVKNIATDFLNANHRPLRAHENIYIFSKGKSVGGNNGGKNFMHYNPQFESGEPYSKQRAGKYEGYNSKERISSENEGKRYPKTVLCSRVQNEKKEHPTQKDLAIFRYLIRTYTNPAMLVVDPYVGSGTTAVAAKAEGRRFIAGDTDEAYCAMARLRLARGYDDVQVDENAVQIALF